MKKTLNLLFLILVLSACGSDEDRTLATLEITEASVDELHVAEATLDLKKGDVIEFWNEMDVESAQGDSLNLIYTLVQFIDGEKIGGTKLDALSTNPTYNEVKTQVNDQLKLSFYGKMTFMKIEQDGKYRFQVVLNTSDEDVKINKADFIIAKG